MFLILSAVSMHSLRNIVPLIPDFHFPGENEEVVKGAKNERGSDSCLKRSSVVLGSSSLSVPVLDSDLNVTNSLSRRPSIEGTRSCFKDEIHIFKLKKMNQ